MVRNMEKKLERLIETLAQRHSLPVADYEYLIANRSQEAAERLAALARQQCQQIYGNRVFIRGLIEVSNICKNDCLYCGIRRGNHSCQRYRLTEEEILACCAEGYALGFRTFVLQGGEDGYFTDDRLCALLKAIKERYPIAP